MGQTEGPGPIAVGLGLVGAQCPRNSPSQALYVKMSKINCVNMPERMILSCFYAKNG